MKCDNCKYHSKGRYSGLVDFSHFCDIKNIELFYNNTEDNCKLVDEECNLTKEGKKVLLERKL